MVGNGNEKDIYNPQFVKGVFDRCGRAYRQWSAVASFGFVWIWRKQCISNLPINKTAHLDGFDLMAGTGELWTHLKSIHGGTIKIKAIDISATMVENARKRLHAGGNYLVEIIEADVLQSTIQPDSGDYVVSAFGLKTFSKEQQRSVAFLTARILRRGGAFSFVEASDPHGWIFRPLYRTYMDKFLPLVERLFLNGAQDFSMIGEYTRNFVDCRHFASCLEEAGLNVEYKSYFFGCASGVRGIKP